MSPCKRSTDLTHPSLECEPSGDHRRACSRERQNTEGEDQEMPRLILTPADVADVVNEPDRAENS